MTSREKDNPITRFQSWLEEARNSDLREPTAVALATNGLDGMPNVRMVMLKDVTEAGFVFYTNLNSNKGRQLAADPRASLCFYWMPLGKQVRVRGSVEPIAASEADRYFASRDRMSQIGAWASRQSEPLESRFALEKRVAEYTARFVVGEVPRPPFWSGYRLVPRELEFWEEKLFRLHNRFLYTRSDDGWTMTRLYP